MVIFPQKPFPFRTFKNSDTTKPFSEPKNTDLSKYINPVNIDIDEAPEDILFDDLIDNGVKVRGQIKDFYLAKEDDDDDDES